MRALAETKGVGLQWFQPDFTGLFQVIQDQDDVLATLRVAQGSRGLEGLAEAAEGNWHFQSKGLFKRYTEIATTAGLEVGRFKASGAGDQGAIEMPSGTVKYSWMRRSEPRLWQVIDQAGFRLVDLVPPPRTDVSSRALAARIDVDPTGLNRPELSLLVLFAGFLMVRNDGVPEMKLEDTEKKLGIFDYGRKL